MRDIVNLGDIVRRDTPDHPLIYDLRDPAHPRVLTAGELRAAIAAVALGLLKRGYQQGDRIGIISQNRWEFLASYFGIMSAGMIAVPVNFRLPRTTIAFVLADAGGSFSSNVLAWDRAGRWVAGATLIAAAVYELTPLKDVCLGKCRSPLGFLLGSWRDGAAGGLQMGLRHGGWCIGCCWALMVSLFALGVMSIVWMAFVAGLVAFEKFIPFRRAATYGTAGVLLVVGVLLVAAPDTMPGLTIPGSGTMSQMNPMRP